MRDLNLFERSYEEKHFLIMRAMAYKLKSNQKMFYRLAMEIMKCRKPREFEYMRLAVRNCPHISLLDKAYLMSYLDERLDMWTR